MKHQRWLIVIRGVAGLVAVAALFTGCAHFQQGNVYGHTFLPTLGRYEERQTPTDYKEQVRDLYAAGQPDSALVVLRRWTDVHGFDLVNYRTYLLMNIATGRFSEELFDRSIIDNIVLYRQAESNQSYAPYSYYAVGDWGFEPFTIRLAEDLAPSAAPNSIERLLCDCFRGHCDSLFLKLNSPSYSKSDLARYWRDETTRVWNMREDGHFAFYSGIWTPTRKSTHLGAHPILGAVMGGVKQGYIYNFASEVRLLDATSPYIARLRQTPDTTASFVGYYVGLEFGREIFRTPRHAAFARIGAGLDGFAYDNPAENKPKRKVDAFNFNVGAGYRLHFERFSMRYVGVEVVYNALSYDRKAGSALNTDAVTVRLLLGWSGNMLVNDRLRELDYGR